MCQVDCSELISRDTCTGMEPSRSTVIYRKTIDKRFDRLTAGCGITPREDTPGSDSPFTGDVVVNDWRRTTSGQWGSDERGTVFSVKHELCLTNGMHFPHVEYGRACLHGSGLVSSIVLKLGLPIHTFIVSMVFMIHGVEIPPTRPCWFNRLWFCHKWFFVLALTMAGLAWCVHTPLCHVDLAPPISLRPHPLTPPSPSHFALTLSPCTPRNGPRDQHH